MKENNIKQKFEDFYKDQEEDRVTFINDLKNKINQEINQDFEFTSHLLVTLNQALDDYFEELRIILANEEQIDLKELNQIYDTLFIPKHFRNYYDILADYFLTNEEYKKTAICLNLAQIFVPREINNLALAALVTFDQDALIDDENFMKEIKKIKTKKEFKIALTIEHKKFIKKIINASEINFFEAFSVLANDALNMNDYLKDEMVN